MYREVKATAESIEKIMRDHSTQDNNLSIITLNSSAGDEPEKAFLGQLTSMNPKAYYYYFCYNVRDYIFFVGVYVTI